ncbi:MAG: xanthine dehydrogenase family protein [Actinobacteria bacterium]|nr:xanthine dehydrogenase family protein [Actinomycetota bacterium]
MSEQGKVTWIGKPVPRREDRPLTAGAGRYMADIEMPGMLYMVVLRSPQAHAKIVSIDTDAARAMPGVHAVYTAADLPEELKPFPVIWRPPVLKDDSIAALASDRVRNVGEEVAVVVADTQQIAEDARELIRVKYERLPANVDPIKALEPDSPRIRDEWDDNVAALFPFRNGDVDAAFAEAAHVVDGHFKINRHAAMPMETRGVVASWDALTETLTFWSMSQAASLLRTELAKSLDLPDNAIRVMTPNVGGAFGAKWDRYAEDLLACVATRRLGRPVKWMEDRREHFQSTVHAREQIQDWEMALDEDGRILGVRGRAVADLGSCVPSSGIGTQWVTGNTIPNQYKFENYSADIIAVLTNKARAGSYRGFGGPESNFPMERLMDKAAKELGVDPAELRFRNQIQPEDMPYPTATGMAVYDTGDYPGALRRALEMVGYEKLREEQPKLREQGIYRGLGIGCYVHCTGFGPSAMLGMINYDTSGYEGARIRIDPGGKVTVYTGMIPLGQGTETSLAQIAADSFGIDMDDVRVVWGDTSQTPYTGFGSGGSRSNLAMTAVMNAAEQLKAKMIRIAAHTLEASPDDVEFADGHLSVRGVPDSGLTMPEVARIAYLAHSLPEGEEPMLQTQQVFDPPGFGWAYGCHVGVVDVDIQTGMMDWKRYVIVDDCGPMVNPLIVRGQIEGGVAQGIGGALLEEMVYDEAGQPMTSSFMDYLMPTFHDVPDYEIDHLVSPSPHIRGGFKGMGESGVMAPAAVVANAIVDALAPFGIEVDELPITPNVLWRKLRDAGAFEDGRSAASVG